MQLHHFSASEVTMLRYVIVAADIIHHAQKNHAICSVHVLGINATARR